MQQLKKFICLLLFLFIMTACQEKIAYDKEWAANFAQQQVKAMDGYRLEGVYFYQGNHIRGELYTFWCGAIVLSVPKGNARSPRNRIRQI